MKKAQINYFLIIGIILVIVAGSFFVLQRTNKEKVIEDGNTGISDPEFKNAQVYLEDCTKNSVVKANEEIGLNEEEKEKYQYYLESEINRCMDSLLLNLKELGYTYVEADMTITAEYADNTITLKVDYPTKLEKDDKKFFFNSVNTAFDKTQYLKVNEDSQLMLVSSDSNARLVIQKDTDISLEKGDKVENIGIKVVEKNFDGLENGIVIGNLVYEGLPDGAKFSKPVEISIEYRKNDLLAYHDESSLSIAWWDETLKIWRGIDTTCENGVCKAEVNHFTKFAIVVDCGSDGNKVIVTPNLFKQKYSLIHPDIDSSLPIEEQAKLEAQYTKEDIEFCTVTDDKYWIDDFGSYIPSLEQYIKYKNNDPDRIDKTIQELYGENVVFGPDINPVSCKEEPVHVASYRCCTKSQGCILDGELKGLQECMDLYGENLDVEATIDYKNNPDIKDIFMQANVPNLGVERQIFGYNHWSCVAGKTEDGNGDGVILAIGFDQKGGACLKEDVPIEVTVQNVIAPGVPNPSSAGCSVSTNLGDFSSNGELSLVDILSLDFGYLSTSKKTTYGEIPGMEILIYSARADDASGLPMSVCNTCQVQIKLVGTGFSANGFSVCESADESLFVNGECKKCKLDPGTGLILASESDGDCSCTRQMEGYAWCDYDNNQNPDDPKICVNGLLQEWKSGVDPDGDEDYNFYIRDGGCNKCSTEGVLGDSPCEKAVIGGTI